MITNLIIINNMNLYKITTKNDTGKYTFKVYALDIETAKLMVMKSEGCPECAITKITEKKLIYKP
jgi:hypothetical protein